MRRLAQESLYAIGSLASDIWALVAAVHTVIISKHSFLIAGDFMALRKQRHGDPLDRGELTSRRITKANGRLHSFNDRHIAQLALVRCCGGFG